MPEKFFERLEEMFLGSKKERNARICPHGQKYLDEPIECLQCQGIERPYRKLTEEETKQAKQKITEIKSILEPENLRKIVKTSAQGEDEQETKKAEQQIMVLKNNIAWLEKEGLADVFILKSGLEKLLYEATSKDDTDDRYNYVTNSGAELEPNEEILSQDPADLEEYDKKIAVWKKRVKKAGEAGKTFGY